MKQEDFIRYFIKKQRTITRQKKTTCYFYLQRQKEIHNPSEINRIRTNLKRIAKSELRGKADDEIQNCISNLTFDFESFFQSVFEAVQAVQEGTSKKKLIRWQGVLNFLLHEQIACSTRQNLKYFIAAGIMCLRVKVGQTSVDDFLDAVREDLTSKLDEVEEEEVDSAIAEARVLAEDEWKKCVLKAAPKAESKPKAKPKSESKPDGHTPKRQKQLSISASAAQDSRSSSDDGFLSWLLSSSLSSHPIYSWFWTPPGSGSSSSSSSDDVSLASSLPNLESTPPAGVPESPGGRVSSASPSLAFHLGHSISQILQPELELTLQQQPEPMPPAPLLIGNPALQSELELTFQRLFKPMSPAPLAEDPALQQQPEPMSPAPSIEDPAPDRWFERPW